MDLENLASTLDLDTYYICACKLLFREETEGKRQNSEKFCGVLQQNLSMFLHEKDFYMIVQCKSIYTLLIRSRMSWQHV